MEISEALTFLELSQDSTADELESSFRRLAMKYHPDRNAERVEWSHRMTVLLYEAHEVAARRIAAEAVAPPPFRPPESDADITRRFAAAFSSAREKTLESIYLYYSFGLENVHLRYEGVRRYRYNSAVNHMRKGLASLEAIENEAAPNPLKRHAALFKAFGGAFLENMGITQTFVPDGSENHKAYRHYQSGSVILDSLVKNRFFPEDFPRENLTPKSVQLCEQEFFLVLTRYRMTVWLPETVIKLSLLDNLKQLINYEADMTRF